MSAFQRVIILSVSKVGRKKERGAKELRINWERDGAWEESREEI